MADYLNQIQTALGNAVKAAYSGEKIAFTTQGSENLASAQTPVRFIRCDVKFDESNQLYLGNTDSRRIDGFLTLLFHVPQADAPGDNNTLMQVALDGLQSKSFSGVVLFKGGMLPLGENGGWIVSGVQIPFKYDHV